MASRVLKRVLACCASETSEFGPLDSLRKWRWSRRSGNCSAVGVNIVACAMIALYCSDSNVRTRKYFFPLFSYEFDFL